MYPPDSFRWVQDLENRLAGSAKPTTRQEVDWLVAKGIRAIVSLSSLSREVMGHVREHGLHHLDFPVRDFEPPDMATLPEAMSFIDANLTEGRPVLVHCAAGHGRTGTLLAAYLVSKGQALRGAMRRAGSEPESHEQRDFLDLFERRMNEPGPTLV